MEEKNYTGEKFLDKLYKDLFNSEIVEHTKEKSDSREEAIKKYMDRLEKAHQNATTENRKERLKRLYYDKYIIKEENLPKNLTDEQKTQIIENQKLSLDKWLDYLTDENARYPMWAKYWVFQGMLKMGTYDEAHEVYQNRSKKTLAPFVDANTEIIANAIDILEKKLEKKEINDEKIKKVIETGSFSKIYTILQNKYKKNLTNNENIEGIWVKYNEGNKEEAIKLAKSLEGKNTGWCTASENMAISQVCGGNNYQGGDFYVYYTKDNENNYTNPRIAIRMDGKKEIGEIEESQNMEECMIPIIEKKLHEMDFLNQEEIEKYLDKIEGLKELSILNKKTAQNIPLTLNETINLYTKEYGFGWQQDPKAKKIIQIRNKDEDFKIFKQINDKKTAIEVILKIHIILKYFCDCLKKDKEVVLEAVRQYGEELKYADESLKKDKEFVIEVVRRSPSAFEYADESLKKDKEFVLEAVRNFGCELKYVDKSLKKDKEVVLAAVRQDGYELKYVDESLKKDKEVVLAAVRRSPSAFEYADESLKKDKEVVLEAVRQNGYELKYADESLKKDKEVVLEAVRPDGQAFEYADESLKKDKEVVLAAVRQGGQALEYADDSLKKDKEIVLEAVRNKRKALEYADDSLKKDKEFVLEAVRNNGYALEYADDSLKKDKEVVLAAVRQGGQALEYADDSLKKDKEIVLEAVRNKRKALEYADDSLKKDKEFVLEAVRNNGYALEYADDSLKQDKDVVLEAVKDNHQSLDYAEKKMLENRDFMLQAVKENGYTLKYANEFFPDDKKIALAALCQTERANVFLNEKFRDDPKFFIELKIYKIKEIAKMLKSIKITNIFEGIKSKDFKLVKDKRKKKTHDIIIVSPISLDHKK